jgi:hypothetical protein
MATTTIDIIANASNYVANQFPFAAHCGSRSYDGVGAFQKHSTVQYFSVEANGFPDSREIFNLDLRRLV